MLSIHKLDCYRIAVLFVELVKRTSEKLPPGHADDADQLARAARSIVRNIAEGAGRQGVADKKRVYAIARGEAMECAGSVDLLMAEGLISQDDHREAMVLLERIVAMLTKLILKPK